jgi:hypothetical protein
VTTVFDPGAEAARATDAILRDTLHGTPAESSSTPRPAPASPRSSSAPRSNWPTRGAR